MSSPSSAVRARFERLRRTRDGICSLPDGWAEGCKGGPPRHGLSMQVEVHGRVALSDYGKAKRH